MPSNDLYILPEAVQLIPVRELNEQAKSKFDYDDNDFVITFSNTRNTSKVIDCESACLLKEFRTPRSFVESVFRYSMLNKKKPDEILEESYTFLSRLRSEGFLILYNKDAPPANDSLLKPGHSFYAYEVVAKIQVLSDTEVYKIKKEDSFYALKILKKNGQTFSENFCNEIEILKSLDGKINPGLIETGEYTGHEYLITAWFDGISCDQAAEKYRNTGNPANVVELVDLSLTILAAYEYLHRQGIIHSDIHPRNILVSENKEVCIIDFGLSRMAEDKKYRYRGGIGFFYEPEYAHSILKNEPQPMSSFAGEQYALGAVIYLLVSGKQYQNFSYEKETLFRQIAYDMPLPFEKYDVYIEPEIELAIFKALSKNAGDRFGSVAEFAAELSRIKNKLTKQNQLQHTTRYSFNAFCNSLKKKFGFDGKLVKEGLQLAPTCSVNYGAAGIAYIFYRMAIAESNPELLTVADVWANRALDYTRQKEAAFYSTDMDITSATVGDISIYHTASGVHLVQALISQSMGDYNSYAVSVMNFMADVSKPCENLDLTLGKSGVLIGCATLYGNIFKMNSLREKLKKTGDSALAEIWSRLEDCSPDTPNGPVLYRGIAHGWAGIVYASLLWCMRSGTSLPAAFFKATDQLMHLAIRDDRGARWNLSHTDSNSWTGWCHGSAGYTFLWAALYSHTKDKQFLEMAFESAKYFLSADNADTNCSLCCGLAGESYASLTLYNLTGETFYLTRAKTMSKTILENVYSPQMRNNSLYKGDIGAGILFSELAQPQNARMPLFEL